MTEAWIVISLLAGGLVLWDAKRLGVRFGGPSRRDGSLGPLAWTVLVVLMRLVAGPFYVWRRRRYARPNT
jgi:hypothetical protein